LLTVLTWLLEGLIEFLIWLDFLFTGISEVKEETTTLATVVISELCFCLLQEAQIWREGHREWKIKFLSCIVIFEWIAHQPDYNICSCFECGISKLCQSPFFFLLIFIFSVGGATIFLEFLFLFFYIFKLFWCVDINFFLIKILF
jgi:hypothetical protein